MGHTVKIKENTWVVVPADIYSAKLVKLEELDLEFGPSIKLIFEIVDGDYAGEKVDGIASLPPTGISSKSKLYTWILALSGESLEELENFELDDLIGKHCRLNIVETTNKKSDPVNKIEAVLPPPKKKPRPAPRDDTDF